MPFKTSNATFLVFLISLSLHSIVCFLQESRNLHTIPEILGLFFITGVYRRFSLSGQCGFRRNVDSGEQCYLEDRI